MNDRDKRKLKMQELIQGGKEKRKLEIDPLFKECVEVLHPNVDVLSQVETKQLYDDLQKRFPFVWWGRIDWDNFKDKKQVVNAADIMLHLNNRFQTEDYIIYALWGLGNSSVIKTNLQNAISHIHDVNSVGGDQWLYCPSHRFVIEFYHEGDIIIGFES